MKIETREFSLSATLESGQVFGFTNTVEGRYRGVLMDSEVELWEDSEALFAESLNGAISKEKLEDYFDLNRDLLPVYRFLEEDPNLRKLPVALKGLRVIRQDPWEALASFIISSNNNIKRIKLIWNNLSCCLRTSGVRKRFPRPEEIAELDEGKLRELGLGYRAPFLLRTAKRIASDAHFLSEVSQSDYENAKDRLLELDGVGPKVADCVLLFGFHKGEAFPVDVWIERAMKKLYFPRKRRVSESRIAEFARARWGNLAGYVQQYLFHGIRKSLF